MHRKMDYAWYYFRRGHRCFGHDPISAIAIATESYPGDYNAVQAALFHIDLDKLCSRDPELKKMLQFQAKLDSARRRPKGRSKKAQSQKSVGSADHKQFTEFIEKLERICRLARLLTS